MTERRSHWKENISKAAQARHEKRIQLLTKLDEHREELRNAGLDFEKRDAISLKMRETAARLVTL